MLHWRDRRRQRRRLSTMHPCPGDDDGRSLPRPPRVAHAWYRRRPCRLHGRSGRTRSAPTPGSLVPLAAAAALPGASVSSTVVVPVSMRSSPFNTARTLLVPPDSAMDRISRGIQAHSAPLGLTFFQNTNAPDLYRAGAAVGLHGSWNRSQRQDTRLHTSRGTRSRSSPAIRSTWCRAGPTPSRTGEGR